MSYGHAMEAAEATEGGLRASIMEARMVIIGPVRHCPGRHGCSADRNNNDEGWNRAVGHHFGGCSRFQGHHIPYRRSHQNRCVFRDYGNTICNRGKGHGSGGVVEDFKAETGRRGKTQTSQNNRLVCEGHGNSGNQRFWNYQKLPPAPRLLCTKQHEAPLASSIQ